MTYSRRIILKKIDILMLEHPRIPLSAVSRSIGVERHTIEKAVRASRQMSFREYRRSKLSRKAQKLLEGSTLTVGEIGVRLGYNTISSFSRFLQRSTGKSPSQYRRELPG